MDNDPLDNDSLDPILFLQPRRQFCGRLLSVCVIDRYIATLCCKLLSDRGPKTSSKPCQPPALSATVLHDMYLDPPVTSTDRLRNL